MASTPTPPKRKRSPNYPAIDLGVAVARARTLWEHEQHHPIPYEVAVQHWGYGPKSSGGAQTFAALRRFGLLDAKGKTQGQLSSLGLSIVQKELEGNRDIGLLQAAAFSPPSHRELWDEYGAQLPSDETLKWRLIRQGFTPGGASEFIDEWKRTMAFAGLDTGPVNVSSPTEDLEEPEATAEAMPSQAPPTGPAPRAATARPAPGVASYPLPLRAGLSVTLTGPFPLGEAEWERMLSILEALKPGLIQPDEPDQD